MAKKVFTYRGKTLDELKKMSKDEFMQLLPSGARRTLKRGYTEAAKKANAKILEGDNVKTHVREIVIMPRMVGKLVKVHNGKGYEDVRITEDMIGHRLGEFSKTRNRVDHSAPGVGATRSSAALSVR